jgi:hypothetical protein
MGWAYYAGKGQTGRPVSYEGEVEKGSVDTELARNKSEVGYRVCCGWDGRCRFEKEPTGSSPDCHELSDRSTRNQRAVP